MDIEFILREEVDRLKHYYTKDEELKVIERPDQFFLLYRLNHQDDCYDWTESYYHSLDECVENAVKLIGKI